jgi:hypothetical protein
LDLKGARDRMQASPFGDVFAGVSCSQVQGEYRLHFLRALDEEEAEALTQLTRSWDFQPPPPADEENV